MSSNLPPLRALQTFEAFGKTGTVQGAARALGVSSGAVSQQLRLLEEYAETPLFFREGRGISMTPAAVIYHEIVSQGFERLTRAKDFISAQRSSYNLTVTAMPTFMQRWLNPIIHRFQALSSGCTMHFVSTQCELEPDLMDQTFRLTYGPASGLYPHSRSMFRDHFFPACSPAFLSDHPEAMSDNGLKHLPLITVDWGTDKYIAPEWRSWFERDTGSTGHKKTSNSPRLRAAGVYSISSLALDAAIAGQGVVLAQAAFAHADLEAGRLMRLSSDAVAMPESYFICWGRMTLASESPCDFVKWILNEALAFENARLY